VREGEIYVVLGLFTLMGIIHKTALRSHFNAERVISTPGFRGIIKRDRLVLICKFLHFANIETFGNFESPKKIYKISPIILQLNNIFTKWYLPNQDISINESLNLWKRHLSNSTCLLRHPNLELKFMSFVKLPQSIYGLSICM
jgi:hypothetical protein